MIENKTEFNFKLFWNTRKEFVLAVLFFIISTMILFLGVISQISPIQTSVNDLKKRVAELDKFYEKSQQFKQIAIDPNFNRSSDIDKVLPSHKPLLEILSNLNSVANSSELVIKNFSLNPGEIATDTTKVKKSTSNQKYDYLDLDFSVSGQLAKIQDFLSLIEQVTPISTITHISINRNIDTDKNAQAQANLILRAFYFTQPIRTTITNPLPEIAAADRQILSDINELIPNNLEQQNNVITGDRGNLFGIQDQSIQELEQQLNPQSASDSATISE